VEGADVVLSSPLGQPDGLGPVVDHQAEDGDDEDVPPQAERLVAPHGLDAAGPVLQNLPCHEMTPMPTRYTGSHWAARKSSLGVLGLSLSHTEVLISR
jgi:hypothetical protein